MPAKPPSRRIAASSVSCGDSPMRTCLPVGGCAGLVIEDREAAVTAALDPVGARRQVEGAPIVERNRNLAADLGLDGADIAAPHDFPGGEPCRDRG